MNQSEILARPSFRLLLVPFGGPIPRAGAPRGVDLDGEFFSEKTDVGRGLFDSIPLRFFHGRDRMLGSTRLGTAVLDQKASRDGWWALCHWVKDEPAVDLIRALGQRTPLFGSSQPLGESRKTSAGEITQWHVAEATLGPAVQNLYARLEAA